MYSDLAFTLPEILSLLGLFQSLYILVYMLLRSGNWKYSVIPVTYFLVLAGAFLLDAAATRWSSHVSHYSLYQWGLWIGSVPLGSLLIFQVGGFPSLPTARVWLLLLLIPVSLLPAGVSDLDENMMYVAGLMVGAISMLAVWLRRDLLSPRSAKASLDNERFWLMLSMVVVNLIFLISTLAYVSDWISASQWVILRNALGIGFCYIAATSLLRIYPQSMVLTNRVASTPKLSPADQAVIDRIETLLIHEKVYQEPSYGRTELAQDLGMGEAVLSRIVNIHYGKTIPQLLNDFRVVDAQVLLRETDIPVTQVFIESGFNSLTTFNRVFKDLVGISPSEYRSQIRRL